MTKGLTISSSNLFRQDDEAGGSGRGAKFLIIGVLVAITAGAIYMFTRTVIDGTGDQRARRNLPMYYQCTIPECGHQFEISRRDFNLQHKEVENTRPGMAHCPKCGGRFCSTMRSLCPNCKARVIGTVAGKGEWAGQRVCPECGQGVKAGRPRR